MDPDNVKANITINSTIGKHILLHVSICKRKLKFKPSLGHAYMLFNTPH